MPVMLFGQETKKVKNKDDHEFYHVLKSDKSIRHGNYKKTYQNGSVKVNGYYKQGVKDSIWDFFDYDGELVQKFDYTKHLVVFYKTSKKEKEAKFKLNGPDTSEVQLDSPPLYIGGEVMMFERLIKEIRYPADARVNGISGTVFISFVVDTIGNATNHHVLRGIGAGCDEEALRVVTGIPNDWIPGMLHGKPVEVVYNLPIRFSLK